MRFWEEKTLEQMTKKEWESLCDGCGKCCLLKFEDEDDGSISFTNIICAQFSTIQCGCSVYSRRQQVVSDCIKLSPENIASVSALPQSCAYRRLANKKKLPKWHPLLTGSREAMVRGGHAVDGRVVNEQHIHPDEVEEHIIRWVK